MGIWSCFSVKVYLVYARLVDNQTSSWARVKVLCSSWNTYMFEYMFENDWKLYYSKLCLLSPACLRALMSIDKCAYECNVCAIVPQLTEWTCRTPWNDSLWLHIASVLFGGMHSSIFLRHLTCYVGEIDKRFVTQHCVLCSFTWPATYAQGDLQYKDILWPRVFWMLTAQFLYHD